MINNSVIFIIAQTTNNNFHCKKTERVKTNCIGPLCSSLFLKPINHQSCCKQER